MRLISRAGSVVALAVLAYLLFWPVPIDPLPWKAPPNPGRTGVFAPNALLGAVEQPIARLGDGPEDIARGPDGWFYTGLADGSIVRFDLDSRRADTLVNTGGRPLGVRFDATGGLFVADAYKGLLSVSPTGQVTVLTDQIGGTRFRYTDAVSVAGNGIIWFSDASRRFNDSTGGILDFWESRPTGRLLSYDPANRRTTVHLDTLDFGNGVAVGPGDAYILVNETMAGRIVRLWLTGPKAGQRDVFIDRLPGMPDNISWNGRDIFWVGLVGPRTAREEKVRELPPLLRKILFRVPERLRPVALTPLGWVIGIDTTGRVRYNLQDSTGKVWSVTSAVEADGWLYLASYAMPTVSRIRIPSPESSP
jgi:sugar lactone lactonase YvrE